jgi:hypothetical protein
VEQNGSETKYINGNDIICDNTECFASETKYINGNNIICDNIECFASTAEILRPKKRIKAEDRSTVTIGYIKDKHPDRLKGNQRFRVLFDSGCNATMINKKFVKHWKKQPVKTIKWSTKAGSLRPRKAVTLKSHSLASMSTERSPARLMQMNHTMNHVTMT